MIFSVCCASCHEYTSSFNWWTFPEWLLSMPILPKWSLFILGNSWSHIKTFRPKYRKCVCVNADFSNYFIGWTHIHKSMIKFLCYRYWLTAAINFKMKVMRNWQSPSRGSWIEKFFVRSPFLNLSFYITSLTILNNLRLLCLLYCTVHLQSIISE